MKKALATILALVMAIGLCSVSWATDPASVNSAETLKTAINAATAENNTITLTDNVVLSGSVIINKSGVNLVIDLGGKKISGSSQLFDIYSPVTFKNGTIDVTYNGSGSICVMWLNGGAKLALENDVTVNAAKSAGATGSVFAVGFWNDCNGAELTINGKITGDNGATINGNITTNTNKVAVNGTIEVTGHALYLAGNGTTNINNGACVKGDAGIEIRAGVLNINGGTVESTGTYSAPIANGNGTTASGAALIVAEHTTNQGITVNVNSGNIKAASNGKAIAASDPENTNGNDVKLNVAGGNVVGGIQVEDSIKTAKPVAVSGGTFKDINGGKVDVSEYLESGKQQNADGSVGNKSTGGGYYYAGPSISAVLNGSNKSATDYTSGDYGLIFHSTASYSGFQGVQVDGKALAKGNYTVEDNGGTEVYLKAVYLKTLAAGKHTVTILSSAGNTSMDFTIGGKTTAPQTFDAGIALYVGMALTSAAGAAFAVKKRED